MNILLLLLNLLSSSSSLQKDFVTFIPAIEFSKVAFTSPILTLLSIDDFCILFFCLVAKNIKNGIIAKIIKVSDIFIFNNIINDPKSIANDMNKSSGP